MTLARTLHSEGIVRAELRIAARHEDPRPGGRRADRWRTPSDGRRSVPRELLVGVEVAVEEVVGPPAVDRVGPVEPLDLGIDDRNLREY